MPKQGNLAKKKGGGHRVWKRKRSARERNSSRVSKPTSVKVRRIEGEIERPYAQKR